MVRKIIISINRTTAVTYCIICVAMLVTFIGFILLDPDPSFLLSICVSLNVGIILWGIYRLYKWELLLSPMSSILIGPGWLLCYSWGNIGARIAGEGRYQYNAGSLSHYPTAALLTTVGLVLYCIVIFSVFSREARYKAIRYQDLVWKPWQALTASLFAIIVVGYMSYKYEFLNGYYRGVENYPDKWLAASYYSFVIMAMIIGVSVTVRATRVRDRIIGMTGVVIPMLVALGSRSRTFMILVALGSATCWITLRPKKLGLILLSYIPVVISLFVLGTVVKMVSMAGTSSVIENLTEMSRVDVFQMKKLNIESGEVDFEYRMAGFELPAAILYSLNNDVPPMYGGAIYGGLIQGVPGFLRPEGEFSERLAILDHFQGRGVDYGDSIGVPLTSGLADWGVFIAPLIYIVIAIYCLVMWRIVQTSPRLFFAYLMAGATAGDLFWENGTFAVRSIGFAWMVLLITSPLFMPRYLKEDVTG